MDSSVKRSRDPKKAAQAKPKKVKRHRVICPGCKGVYLETNEKYDPDIPLRGFMLQMAEPYASWMWTRPGSDHDLGPAIECPGCGHPVVWGNSEKPWLEELK